jgi:hypothetical protein
MSLAEICAVIKLVLVKSVKRGEPFQRTCEEGVKFPPLTCKVNAGLPARMLEGAKGFVVLRLGDGKLICSWQEVSNTAAQQIESQKTARDWPRNLFTPGPADHSLRPGGRHKRNRRDY